MQRFIFEGLVTINGFVSHIICLSAVVAPPSYIPHKSIYPNIDIDAAVCVVVELYLFVADNADGSTKVFTSLSYIFPSSFANTK